MASIFVGQGTLPVLCAGALTNLGEPILAVSSPDEPLKRWAADRGIRHIAKMSDVTAFARVTPIDYLFSIVNYRIVPRELLQIPLRLAINYHDGPLPRYGGVRATTWAIMNGETEHGITWHVMTEQIDGGDILKQHNFPIAAADTAHRLNQKCYYTAFAAFCELAKELMDGTEKRLPQDLSQRTYFGLKKAPANDCLISFAWPAEQIERFARALDFENAPNPIGYPKIIVAGRLLAAVEFNRTNVRSSSVPGTVQFQDDSLRVATGTEDVLVRRVRTLSGRPVSVEEIRGYGVHPEDNIEAADLSRMLCPEQM